MTQAQVTSKKHLSKEQIANDKFVGIWSLVAVENSNPDNSRTLPYSTDPKGILEFDTNGNYASQIVRASRPKVAANDKIKPQPRKTHHWCRVITLTLDNQ